MARTKIVATIGPSSNNPQTLREMIHAGMDVARINFSHGEQQEHKKTVSMLREVSAAERVVLAILADLQGPKMRLGQIQPGGLVLRQGDEILLSSELSEAGAIFVPHPNLIHSAQAGSTLIIGDGEIELQVLENQENTIRCEVTLPGILESHKGVHAPDTSLSISSITDKDRRDLEFICSLDVDFVALSFVRSAEDILQLRAMMEGFGMGITPVIAKIENSQAVDQLDEICEAADGIMVARGDLGIEVSASEVPILQKRIIASANKAAKPVITATQMLQSMVSSPRPTRAEASDVANAVLDGSDAVMLSQETASGRFPVEAVRVMNEIAEVTETAFPYDVWRSRRRTTPRYTDDITVSISAAACGIAEEVNAKTIVTTTMSGNTARQIARYRPVTPILAVTPHIETQRRLAIVWGVECCVVEDVFATTDDMFDKTIFAAMQIIGSTGGRLVITAGIPFWESGHSNLIQVHEIE